MEKQRDNQPFDHMWPLLVCYASKVSEEMWPGGRGILIIAPQFQNALGSPTKLIAIGRERERERERERTVTKS